MNSDIITIQSYAEKIRHAFESAKEKGCFDYDCCFRIFPRGCCLRATEVLAEYLYRKGIETIIVQGSSMIDGGTHAWLVINQCGYKPEQITEKYSEKAFAALCQYNPDVVSKKIVRDVFDLENVWEMIIIDLTIDQFNPQLKAPYIGKAHDLHLQYDIRPKVYDGIYDEDLYRIVSEHL